MRRFLIIILIIIVFLGAVGSIGWLLTRRTAVQNGMTPPSFRQFLTFDTKPSPEDPESPLQPDINEPQISPSPDTPETTPDEDVITSSQFTSGPIAPAQNQPTQPRPQEEPGTAILEPAAIPTEPTPIPIVPVPQSGETPTSVASQCSDADITISFTPEEIQRLNALQNRFYAVAGSLRSDADVARELANYGQFKAKTDQIEELYNYCQSASPSIQEPLLQTRVTTPYWRDPARDRVGYVTPWSQGISLTAQIIDPRNVVFTQGVIERIFKVNLW